MDESCVPKREFGSERSLTKSCTYHWEEQAGEMACSEAAKSLLRVMRGELEVGLSSHERSRTAGACDRVRLFDCASCQGFMAQPICFPCGHSLCKSCAVKASAGTRCPKCGADWPRLSPPACEEASASADSRVPTVVLQSALRKWCPQWFACSRSKEEGNRLARAGEYRLAVEAYTRALESGVKDHRVLSNRSLAYLGLGQVEEALGDAEGCCKVSPYWAKAHFRRAVALERMGGDWREAVAAFLLCLHYDSSEDPPLINRVCKLLDEHMLELTGVSDSCDKHPPLVAIVRLCLERMDQYRLLVHHDQLLVPEKLLDASDFECVLCTSLLFEPVTVACGHSFCRSCLARSFDHTPFCPVCRSPLVEKFAEHCQRSGMMHVDVTLELVILHFFRGAHDSKRDEMTSGMQLYSRAGMSELVELPIFVCTLVCPGLHCPLHVFEPRYRLMIRRCIENGSKRFGMCCPDESSFMDYGTVLHINSVQYTPDGRSLVSTTGERRFQVVSRGLRDGYCVAKIRFVVDDPVTAQDGIASLRTLQQETYDHAKKWFTTLPPVSQLLFHRLSCSPLPDMEGEPERCPNGPVWVWWFVNALPISSERKADLLKCTSLKERLLMLRDTLPLPSTA